MSWLIFGAGAQGRILLELVRAVHGSDEWLVVDDSPELQGQRLDGVSIVGRDWLARRVDLVKARAVIAVGDNPVRLRLAGELGAMGVPFGTLVHPAAVVAPSAVLSAGTVVLAGAVVQTGARVGLHVVINSGAIVEHDCTIEEGASISPGCCMAGRVRVGRGAFLGVGVTLGPRVEVGAGAIVGAGAVVTDDVPMNSLAYGVPARVVRSVDPGDWKRLL